MIKLVLAGLKRQLGDTSVQKIPLTASQLLLMFATLTSPIPMFIPCGPLLCSASYLSSGNITSFQIQLHLLIMSLPDRMYPSQDMVCYFARTLLRLSNTKSWSWNFPCSPFQGPPMCSLITERAFSTLPFAGVLLALNSYVGRERQTYSL